IELNLASDARDFAQDAHQRFSSLAIPYEAAKSRANQAIALGQLGDAENALKLFREARKLFVRENNPVWPWPIALYSAVVLIEHGKHLEARRLVLEAAAHFKIKSLKGKAALCQLLLAQVDMIANRPEDAATRCKKALKLLQTFGSAILEFEAGF